jgi:uncharacterized OB-fold protein
MTTEDGGAKRQLPELEPETEFFWTAGATGQLLIARCQSCELYIHPPLPRCSRCGGDVAPAPVSGLGRVATYSVNMQPWLPGMKVPFVFAAVELEEQAQLYVMTNIIDSPIEAVHIGMPVAVSFEQHEDVYLPMFHPRETTHAG